MHVSSSTTHAHPLVDAPQLASVGDSGVQPRRFSIKEAKGLIKDLGRPVPWIYWTDFLSTITCAHALFALELDADRWLPFSGAAFWAVRVAMFAVAAILYMRAVIFIHELVHLRGDSFRAFRVAWNLLCGIPLLVPSFMYYPHVDHHRRKSYGTQHDGDCEPVCRPTRHTTARSASRCGAPSLNSGSDQLPPPARSVPSGLPPRQIHRAEDRVSLSRRLKYQRHAAGRFSRCVRRRL